VELFRRERPDVVVLDLNMPEMGGVAVLQQIRRAQSRSASHHANGRRNA
jgi:CheY-like chemotaxis protein